MNNEKTKSVLAYIFGLIGGLIVLMMKGSEKRTKICAAQSITIALIYYIVRVAYGFIPFNIPFFDYIVSGLYLVASIIGIVKACNDNEEPEISGIGEIAKSLFKKQIEQQYKKYIIKGQSKAFDWLL